MSQLAHELEVILDRWLVVAPNQSTLNFAFENLAQEALQHKAKPDSHTNTQDSDQSICRVDPSQSGIKNYLAFEAGKRAGLQYRLHFLGLSLDAVASPTSKLISALSSEVEGILIWGPDCSEDPKWALDTMFRWNPLKRGKSTPVIFVGKIWGDLLAALNEKSGQNAEKGFLAKAYGSWVARNFSPYKILPRSDRILSETLEWTLSFY